jgi:sugar/nucleoside kinase (ribokinase family)
MSFVAGAGIANIDLIYRGLPKLPAEGEEIYAEGFAVKLGGGVVNTLANLAGLGVPVRAASYLGNDIFSEFALKEMKKSGVEPVNLFSGSGDIPLAISVAALTAADRTFISYIARQEPGDAELDTVYRMCRGAKLVEMQTGYLDVYRTLKKEGVILVFDTGWDEELSYAKYRDYLELADYFTPNRKEALKISGCLSPGEAARSLSRYFKQVLIKLDREGTLVYENGREELVPAVVEFNYADSTGAGDAFLAGFLYGLYHDRDFSDSVLLGNILGGKCASVQGCLSAEMSEAELLALFEKYKRDGRTGTNYR